MLNLKVIRSGNHRYLGVAGVFLIEVPDDDKAISLLIPEGVKFEPSEKEAFTGRNIRMVLRNNTHDCLVIIKNSRSLDKEIKCAELICFVNNTKIQDKDLLNEVRMLASYRWPSGKLFIKTATFKKYNKGLREPLLISGWTYGQIKNGTQILELQLLNR